MDDITKERRWEFRPHCQEAVDVLIDGVLRTDYRIEFDHGQVIIFDDLSYDEACNVQIQKRLPV